MGKIVCKDVKGCQSAYHYWPLTHWSDDKNTVFTKIIEQLELWFILHGVCRARNYHDDNVITLLCQHLLIKKLS